MHRIPHLTKATAPNAHTTDRFKRMPRDLMPRDFKSSQESMSVTNKKHVTGMDMVNSSSSKARRSTKFKLTSKQRVASRVYNLTLDVAGLRQEVQQLTLHRSLLETRARYTQPQPQPNTFESSTPYKTSIEYWEVFHGGYRAGDTKQLAFLCSVADDKLRLGQTQLFGREQLLQQWRLHTEYFAIQRYEMHRVRVIATDDETQVPCTTRGEGVFYGSFTQQALEMVFPAVLHDEELTQQLLGTQMVTPVTFVLHFSSDGRWIRHDTEVDWFAAVARVVGLVKTANVMAHAQVTEEGLVGMGQLHDDRTVSRAQIIERQRYCCSQEAAERDESARCDCAEHSSGSEGRRHALAFVLS